MTAQLEVSQNKAATCITKDNSSHTCEWAHPLHGWANGWSALVHTKKGHCEELFVPSSHIPCIYLPPWLCWKFYYSLFWFRQPIKTFYSEYNFQNLFFILEGKTGLGESVLLSFLFFLSFPSLTTPLHTLLKVFIRHLLSAKQLPGTQGRMILNVWGIVSYSEWRTLWPWEQSREK